MSTDRSSVRPNSPLLDQPERQIAARPGPGFRKNHRRRRLPDEPSLKTLMVAALAGDEPSYRSLLDDVRTLLAAYFAMRVREVSDREDLVQTVLLAVHERRQTYDPDKLFTPWLFAIARYKLADHRRVSRRYVPLDDDGRWLTTPSFEASSSARLDVETLLTTLPRKQSEAIRRTRVYGWSVAEAASAMRIGHSDVKVSAHRGLSKLAALIHHAPPIHCSLPG